MTLRDIRKKRGYRFAKQAAAELDVPETTWSRWEHDPAHMPLRSAWMLADHFGCAIDDIVGHEAPEQVTRHEEAETLPPALQPIALHTLSPTSLQMLASYAEFIAQADAGHAAAVDLPDGSTLASVTLADGGVQ